jgi:hypothetical protein
LAARANNNKHLVVKCQIYHISVSKDNRKLIAYLFLSSELRPTPRVIIHINIYLVRSAGNLALPFIISQMPRGVFNPELKASFKLKGTARRVHIHTLENLLYSSLLNQEYRRATKILDILIGCTEFRPTYAWQVGKTGLGARVGF